MLESISKMYTSTLSDQEYANLLTEASSFLQAIDQCANVDEAIVNSENIPDEVVAMGVTYFVKELMPIPIDDVGMEKIKKSALDSKEKYRELLTLYLATCFLGYHHTGQFTGLSFGITDKELYAAYSVIKAFYDIDNRYRDTHPKATRIFFKPKQSLGEKLEAIVLHRGWTNKD